MSSPSAEWSQPPPSLLTTDTAVEETTLPAACSPPPTPASPVAAMKGKSHWAVGTHLSKGATLHSLPTNTHWRNREGAELILGSRNAVKMSENRLQEHQVMVEVSKFLNYSKY